jgi:hypothetical protein
MELESSQWPMSLRAKQLPRLPQPVDEALGALGTSMNFLTISWDVSRSCNKLKDWEVPGKFLDLLRLKLIE